MAALPDALIDSVCLCGPARRTSATAWPSTERPASGRWASCRWPSRRAERLEQLRLLAELAA